MHIRIPSWLTTALLALIACFALQPQAHAVELAFNGGTCEILQGPSTGISIADCRNLSNQTVDGVHLTFKVDDLPKITMDYVHCDLIGADCFGPEVAPEGTWHGIGGSPTSVADPIIWGRLVLHVKDVDVNDIVATGYWTKNGVAVVPEPESIALGLAGLVAVLMRKNRRRPCKHHTG